MFIDYHQTKIHPETAAALPMLRIAAAIMWGEDGAWLLDTWAAHNIAYFGGGLRLSGLVWGFTDADHHWAFYDPVTNLIHVHFKFCGLNRTPLAQGVRWIVLHEMMLQHVYQTTGETCAETYDKPVWRAEVGRIAALLGVDATSDLAYGHLATFPISMFPDAWKGVINA